MTPLPTPPQEPPRTVARIFPLLIIVIGAVAYLNSLNGAFVFDDIRSILERHGAPLRQWMLHSSRPLVDFSFYLNDRLGGARPAGYHVVNLLLHLSAGLLLLGVAHRLLRRCATLAAPLAFAVAAIWTAHPLLTQSVTYISQRAEVMMGVFYLLTLYAFLRAVAPDAPIPDGARNPGNSKSEARNPKQIQNSNDQSGKTVCFLTESLSWISSLWISSLFRVSGFGFRNSCISRQKCRVAPRGWFAISIAACALGMATKTVMVTAPILVLSADWMLVAGSFREMVRRRALFYAGLFGTWAVPLILLAAPLERTASVGLDATTLSPLHYALTQPAVILHYLALAFWPLNLCFDYAWPAAAPGAAALWPAAALAALILAAAWLVRRHKELGFSALWFLVILAPSSTFMPITDVAVEHRMYLPLAGVVGVAVGAGYGLIARVPWPAVRRGLLAGALAGVVLCLGALTAERNAVYRSPVALWQDVVAKRPANTRAYLNLAAAWLDAGRPAEAARVCNAVLLRLGEFARMSASDIPVKAHGETGVDLFVRSRHYAHAQNYRGVAAAQQGQVDVAVQAFAEAVRLFPQFDSARINLAQAERDLPAQHAHAAGP